MKTAINHKFSIEHRRKCREETLHEHGVCVRCDDKDGESEG